MSGGGGASGGAAVATMGLQMYSAKRQADAMKSQAAFQAQQSRFNAEVLEVQREELLAQAQEDQTEMAKQIQGMLGSQRVALAAQGIDVDSDVALQIQEETREVGRQDLMALKNNAWRKAWGIEVEQMNLRQSATMGVIGAQMGASATLATGGAQALATGLQNFDKIKGLF